MRRTIRRALDRETTPASKAGAQAASEIDAVALATPMAPPTALDLSAPAPNPSRASQSIEMALALPEAATVAVQLYDVQSRQVAALATSERLPGIHALDLEGQGFAPGVYAGVVTITDGRGTQTLTRRFARVR